MGFDDLFENHDKHMKHEHGFISHHQDGYDYAGRSSDYGHRKHQLSYYLLNKIWSNPKLRIASIIIAAILALIVILIVIAIVPLLFKLVDYILQNGVQGIFEAIMGFIEKLWKGTSK